MLRRPLDRQGDRQMYFKFVYHKPLYKLKGIDLHCPINFIVEALRGRYETIIIWKKEDVPPFSQMGEAAFAVGIPPSDPGAYPLEVPSLRIFKEGESHAVRRYYGFGCTLYVMSSKGETIDKLSHNQLGIREGKAHSCLHGERCEIAPVNS